MKRRRLALAGVLSRPVLLLAAATSLTALGADCEGNVVQDPTFRDWCGDSLCSWKLDSGHIKRVPTWNPDDFGVSFLDMGSQISQVTTENEARCLLFTSVADLDPAAQMTLLVDFNNDGTIDFQGPLGATEWHKVEAEITAPAGYDGITFSLQKQGTGTAVLAEMRVLSTKECTAPSRHAPFRLGEKCSTTSDCSTGLSCTADGFCTQCGDEAPCPAGLSCETRLAHAQQCGPGQRRGRPGDPCVLPDDCASQACNGATLSSNAELFGVTDAGCPTVGPQCDLDASPDGVCACVLSHGGTCR